VADYAILESIAKGVSPGSLRDFYEGQDICILRLDCPDGQAKKIVARALGYGRAYYDWLIWWPILRRVGLLGFLRLLWKVLTGSPVEIPRVKDGRVVCVELVQDVAEDAGFPLCPADVLLKPDPDASSRWHLLFEAQST
jgi:hypothetical protein